MCDKCIAYRLKNGFKTNYINMSDKLHIIIITSKRKLETTDFGPRPGLFEEKGMKPKDVIGQSINEEELENKGQNLIEGFTSCLKHSREFFEETGE